MQAVDLNADVGELPDGGEDAALIPLITSANIACGGHAGDPNRMAETVALAIRHKVSVGAHPGYPDREGFGRRPQQLDREQVIHLIVGQVATLRTISDSLGGPLRHVKPHGALYNQAAEDSELAAAVAEGVAQLSGGLRLVGRAGSELEAAARRRGQPFAAEAFVDRGYRRDGSLLSRSEPGALLEEQQAVERRLADLLHGGVTASDGSWVPVRFDTLCIHGDTPGAAKLARLVREWLAQREIEVRPLK
jgi:UPF0271 protein